MPQIVPPDLPEPRAPAHELEPVVELPQRERAPVGVTEHELPTEVPDAL